MASSAVGAECFAESAKTTQGYVDLAKQATVVAKPTYSVKGSAGVRKIRLSTTTAGATIYYTVDGSTPTTKSSVYQGKLLKTTRDVQIRAIAVKNGVSSAVMKKTFRIKTMYGDVTGDGNINQNDYSRLKNYIAGKTKYICTDNADCNGSGGISSKDLTVLSQYLNGTVKTLPSTAASTSTSTSTSSSIKRPGASITKIMGGQKVTLTCSTGGVTMYYTTNGTTPTTSSTKYTGPFIVDSTSTINAIAYKDGAISTVRTFDVSVGTLKDVTADKSTTDIHTTALSVSLTSTAGARILYTTDGSDPRTSTTAVLYDKAITVNKNTVIKAFAQAKGYADTPVATFDYKISGAFNISGMVWDDTPGNTVVSNGTSASTKPGISGITVYLINSTTNPKDAATNYVAKTVTDSDGKYSFNNLVKGSFYKVVFEYNGQKYRAYNAIVANGNQATPVATNNAFTVKANGAFDNIYTSVAPTTPIATYATAITNSYFTQYAATSTTYAESANGVSLALISKNYGVMDLKIEMDGYDTAKNQVENYKQLTFKLTLTNNSPMATTILNDVELELFLPIMTSVRVTDSTGFVGKANYGDDEKAYPGYIKYVISGLSTPGLAPGKSATVTLTGDLAGKDGITINAIAQVLYYSFSVPVYDQNSTPGNLVLGSTRTLERDEAATPTITVVDSTILKQELTAIVDSTTVQANGTSRELLIVAKNCKSLDSLIFVEMTNQGVATYQKEPIQKGDDLYVYIRVYAGSKAGTTLIPIKYGYTTVYLTINVV